MAKPSQAGFDELHGKAWNWQLWDLAAIRKSPDVF
jgi:hypothetical protein